MSRDYITGKVRFPQGPEIGTGEEDMQIVENVDLIFGDNEQLKFGDDADVVMRWDGSVLEMLPATDNAGAFNIGDGTTDIDLKVFLGSTTEYVEFDVGNSRLNMATVPLKWTGTLTGKGLDFNAATFAAGSSNNILSFGDGVGSVTISVTDYHFLIRLNVVNDTNPGSGKLFAWQFLKFAQSTEHQANLDFQGLGLTCELSKNIGYAHVIDAGVNVTETLTITSAAIAGKFGIDVASGKTLTAQNASVILVQRSGAGSVSLGAANLSSLIELKVFSSGAVDCAVNINPLASTSITHAFQIGGATTGLITNLFRFARAGGSAGIKVGPATNNAASDGAIRILIDTVDYYIPIFTAGNTTDSW
jgi:hypothetical protein